MSDFHHVQRLHDILFHIDIAEDILKDAVSRDDTQLIAGKQNDLAILRERLSFKRQDCEICGDQATHERYDEHNGWQPFCGSEACGPE